MMKGSFFPCAKIFVANSVFTNSEISSKGILLIAGQVGVNAITNLVLMQNQEEKRHWLLRLTKKMYSKE